MNFGNSLADWTPRISGPTAFSARSTLHSKSACGVYAYEYGRTPATGWCWMKGFCSWFALFMAISVPNLAVSQDSEKTQLLEVVVTTHDVSRTETLIYLRVFSDGLAEAHPTRRVDFRNCSQASTDSVAGNGQTPGVPFPFKNAELG
jgi:hypothetical protein